MKIDAGMKIMVARLLSSIIAIALILPEVFGQTYHFRHFGTSEGLSQNAVNALAQDQRGFLWVGTNEGGLNRLDGREVVLFDQYSSGISNTVLALEAYGSEFLFVGTPRGLSCLALEPRGRDRTDTALTELFQRKINTPVHRLEMNGNGVLYIESSESAWTFRLEKRELLPSGKRDREWPVGFPTLDFRAQSIDCMGRIWSATDQGLLCVSNSGSRLFDPSNGLPVRDVKTVLVDREGTVWCGTGEGLYLHTPDRIVSYTGETVLPASVKGVWRIAQAPDESVWLGTIGGGVVRISRDGSHGFSTTDGLPSNDVADIVFEGDERTIFATREGLSIRDGNRWNTLTVADGLPDNRIEFIIPSARGYYWLSTHSGLVRWNGNSFETFTTKDGLPSNRITQIAEDRNGDLWIGTNRGPATLSRAARDRIYPIRPLRDVRIASVFIDRRGRPWFGTVGLGVYFMHQNGPVHITRNDGLAGNTVYFISQDRHGTMYFGTNAGVSALPESGIDHFILTNRMEQYHRGQDAGIRLQQRPSFFTLTTLHGLAGNEMNSGAVLRDSSGRMWFGAIGGVSRYQPQEPVAEARWFPHGCTNPVALNVMVTRMQVGQTERDYAPRIDLGPDDHLLRVQCVLPSFRNPGDVRYLYRLEGMESSWHENTTGEILYTGLQPGSYTLIVTATIGEGIWTGPVAVMECIVHPPFHRTAWFWIVVVLTAAGLGYMAQRYRMRKQLEIERIRTRIAADLHDAIGASLSSISLLGDVEERRRASKGDHDTLLLSRMRSLARQAVRSMSEIVWAINPARDNVRALAEKMRESIEDAASVGREVSFSYDEALASLSLHADTRRHLLHLFQEAFNNALKHSRASVISVILQRRGRTLLLSVEDNGLGFDPSRSYPGNGLSTMRMRAREMKWELDIRSAPGETRVGVRVNP